MSVKLIKTTTSHNYHPTNTQPNWWVWILGLFEGHQYWYRNHYLHSAHWCKTRLGKIVEQKGMCAECGKKLVMYGGKLKWVDVHHLTYHHIWNERSQDLQVLCRECHEKRHHE